MDEMRFDGLIRSLGSGATRRGAMGMLLGLAGLGLGEAAAKRRSPGKARQRRVQAASADKVTLCHYVGNDSRHSITVSAKAAAQHIANHGDFAYDNKRGGCCTDADCGAGASCFILDNGDGTRSGVCSCLSDGMCCGTRIIECALRCCPGTRIVDSPDCGGSSQMACVAQ